MRLGHLAASLAICGPVACTLLSDLNELGGGTESPATDAATDRPIESGPGDDAASDAASDLPVDTSSEPGDAATSDAVSDQTSSDGGADATLDAASDVVVDGSVSPCPGVFAFCVDFDDGQLTPHWTTIKADATGLLEIVGGHSVSPPSSLRAVLVARSAAATGSVHSMLEKYWSNVWSTVVVETDVRVTAPTWAQADTQVRILNLYQWSDTTYYGVYVRITNTATSVDFDSDGKPAAAGPAFPYDSWVRTRIEMSPTGATFTYGSNVLHFPHALASPGSNPTALLQVGLASFSGPHPEIEVHYDNVTVSVTD
jgi:hypothetical protein